MMGTLWRLWKSIINLPSSSWWRMNKSNDVTIKLALRIMQICSKLLNYDFMKFAGRKSNQIEVHSPSKYSAHLKWIPCRCLQCKNSAGIDWPRKTISTHGKCHSLVINDDKKHFFLHFPFFPLALGEINVTLNVPFRGNKSEWVTDWNCYYCDDFIELAMVCGWFSLLFQWLMSRLVEWMFMQLTLLWFRLHFIIYVRRNYFSSSILVS